MVLVMESDGSLTPSRSQSGFARNYNDGVGQGSAADELAIFGSDETVPEREAMRFAARVGPAPLPRADVLNAIETTALRYASHPGLRRAELGVVIATLAVLGVFLSWFFNIIDLRQALWVLVGIAGVAAAPTIVAAVFAGG